MAPFYFLTVSFGILYTVFERFSNHTLPKNRPLHQRAATDTRYKFHNASCDVTSKYTLQRQSRAFRRHITPEILVGDFLCYPLCYPHTEITYISSDDMVVSPTPNAWSFPSAIIA
jgi:hypothetical protein